MATGLESIAPMSINRPVHKFAFNTYDTFVVFQLSMVY